MADPNAAQAEYWSSEVGRKWIALQPELDAAMAPVLTRLLDLAAIKTGEAILDIGCGTGTSAEAAARQTGPAGSVAAVDISAPLLDRARSRCGAAGVTNISFLLADAQTHPFPAPDHDLAISRFGVMFFADAVAAFANIARGLRPGGRMVFAAWGPVDRNPWFTIPRDAAVARVGKVEPADPLAPGPLAFQDAGRIMGLMQQAGLADVGVKTEMVPLTPAATSAEAARLAVQVGPAVRVLHERNGSPEDAAAVEAAVAKAFSAYEENGGVSIPAAIHYFNAVTPRP